MKTKFRIHLLLLFVAGALLAGCSKDSTTPENGKDDNNPTVQVSKDNSLTNFSFKKDKNTSLESNCSSTVNGDLIYITVPDGVSLATLVPSFNVHEKATVKAGTTAIQSGSSTVDFSKAVTITVTAENGSSRSYTVLAKNGNQQVDAKIYSFMIKHNIPGVSVALSKDEEIVYTAAYGYADKETKERVTSDHMFRLASMSKQHTAIGIMKLVEQGHLKLTDTVFGKEGVLYNAYGDNMGSDWKAITIEQLLSHTSGILTEGFFGAGSAFSGKNLDERIATLLSKGEVKWAPGAVYEYNNSNFAILGKVIEVVSGKEYMKFLKDEIYTPNGITGIDAGSNDGPIKGEVRHYSQNSVNPYDNNVEAGVAAGGVVASAPALMKLMALLDYGTKVPDIFKKETLDRMYTPINVVDEDGDKADQYCLGWRTNYSNYPDWPAFHGGTLAGVCPIWARSYDNVNGVILCNSRSYNQSIDSDIWHMLEDLQEMYR